GKTTTAINLAAALALRGKRTLLVDLDPQANSTMSFLDIGQVTRSVYDAVADGQANLADIIVQSPVENLWVAPSRIAEILDRRLDDDVREVENLWVAPSRIALAKLEGKLVGELDAH